MLMVIRLVDPMKTPFWITVWGRISWGEITELGADIIIESMYSQCDVNRIEYLLLEAFINHRKNGSALSRKVIKRWEILRTSIASWDICYQWKDGSTSWEKLSNLTESHPIQVAKYAIAQVIKHEPAFNWWVHHVLKKKDRIISMVKRPSAWYLKWIQKFGPKLPNMVKEAIAINKNNLSTLWQDAIQT